MTIWGDEAMVESSNGGNDSGGGVEMRRAGGRASATHIDKR